jgi:prolipoprotein diacylglyceryltransferase
MRLYNLATIVIATGVIGARLFARLAPPPSRGTRAMNFAASHPREAGQIGMMAFVGAVLIAGIMTRPRRPSIRVAS